MDYYQPILSTWNTEMKIVFDKMGRLYYWHSKGMSYRDAALTGISVIWYLEYVEAYLVLGIDKKHKTETKEKKPKKVINKMEDWIISWDDTNLENIKKPQKKFEKILSNKHRQRISKKQHGRLKYLESSWKQKRRMLWFLSYDNLDYHNYGNTFPRQQLGQESAEYLISRKLDVCY